MSKSFGDYKDPQISNYIRRCISRSEDYPQFFDVNTGKKMLLSPYYRKHLVPLEYYQTRFINYLHMVQTQGLDFLDDESYNPEYLDPDIIHDINSKRSRAQRKDLHLKRVKVLIYKKSL